ncbi:TPA: carbonic anhydrase [Candidatus Micrarchaeota archaeon]|nr:carbonic anhydrase [Candidatus Micrarchaeota archaeon]
MPELIFMDVPANVLEKARKTNTYDIVAKLVDGNKQFINGKSIDPAKTDGTKRKELLAGQEPWFIVLACSDSRVVPEYIFNVGLGECFSIEVAGNVATLEAIESIRYAALHLHTRLMVVLGHSQCGAVTATLEGHTEDVPNIGREIRKNIGDEKDLDSAIETNAIATAKKIENDEQIKPLVGEGLFAVIVGIYDLDSGKVEFVY